jgi:uncharacterized protein YcbX
MKVSRLFYYPVKSLQGVEVNQLHLDAFGAVNDRRYMLVDSSGRFVTQRQYPKLALINLTAVEAGYQIHIPEQGDYFLPLQGEEKHAIDVVVWNDKLSAFEQKQWQSIFTDFLGVETKLVYMAESNERLIDKDYCHEDRLVSFADGFPLLFCTESSLDFLNANMQDAISIERFRPNVVIAGIDAFAEKTWQQLDITGQVFNVVKPCSRCVVPTINPKSAKREPAVFKTLQRFCKGDDGQVYFGQNVIHQESAKLISVGDEVLNC